MFIAYVVVTALLAAYLTYSAWADFVRHPQVLDLMSRAGVPESSMPVLGALKGAGALGLLVGFAVPLIGTAAAFGVILFFVGALITHVRARLYGIWIVFPSVALLWTVAALALRLAASMAFGLGVLSR
jgi:hypothetical protein